MKKLGFSLIELLVVIAILGIIAAIAVPIYNRYIYEAEIGGIFRYLSSVMTQIDNTRATTGSWPGSGTSYPIPSSYSSAISGVQFYQGPTSVPYGPLSGQSAGGYVLVGFWFANWNSILPTAGGYITLMPVEVNGATQWACYWQSNAMPCSYLPPLCRYGNCTP